jgi:probable HAF family extracellular repeat protein
MIRTTSVVAAALAVILIGNTCLAAVQYTITEIGTLGGTISSARGINAAGQVAGTARVSAGHRHAFRYSGGVMTDLGTLGGTESVGAAINDAGQVTGWSRQGNETLRAYLYSGGTIGDLGTLGGTSSQAWAINNGGQVAGFARRTDDVTHAFLWTNGTMLDLGKPHGTGSRAFGMNDLGDVVGEILTSTDSRPFLYSGGTMSDFGTPLGWTSARANDINNLGQIVGYAVQQPGGSSHAFLYHNGVATDLGTLGSYSIAQAINQNGQIVGQAGTGAFLYSGGQMLDLSTLLVNGSGWTLTSADGINDVGQIVGYGTNPAGQTRGFLLTPIPEPAMTALLGVAGIFVFRRPPRARRIQA